MKSSAVIVLLSVILVGISNGRVRGAGKPWSIESSADWMEAQASANNVTTQKETLVLESAGEGRWTGKWHDWQGIVDSAQMIVEAEMDLFDNKKIEVVVHGSEKPYTDAGGVEHDWYGRCMIAIIDENRWIMALRSGVDHISWDDGDTIHLLTSTNEGRTWSSLNRWFDGTPIEGMPYEDGKTHSEVGLYRMPNGDLILQLWRTAFRTGTKQLRSTDNGKTWVVELDRVRIEGVTGADDDFAIGTEDWFVDPENPSHVYIAFQYYHYPPKVAYTNASKAGCILAKSQDNGKSYSFLSWINPLAIEADGQEGSGHNTNEPAIEYVGNRTIVAVMRGNGTFQAISTDMGVSFGPMVDIGDQIRGEVSNGLWQRARIYKENNPYFQHNNSLDYAQAEGLLWGFGIHSNGGGYTRKPVVYWSADNGQSWNGPELLHGPMYPGTDTGYGDLKRRVDGTFVAATYYCQLGDSSEADVEQYTFGG